MTQSNSPYIYRPGQMMQHPPFMQQDSTMYGFFVKGDSGKIQHMLDRDLNAPARGEYIFQPLSDYVMLTFTDIKKDFSTFPADRAKGWGPEVDVSIWVPIGSFVTKNGQLHLDQIYWYTPYIWVDSPITIPVGRDIYGYPKNLGQFSLPEPNSPDHFSARVNGHAVYAPDNEVSWMDLLKVDNLSPGGGVVNKWKNFAEALKGIWEVASSFNILRPDVHVVEELIHDLLQPQIPQVFLKQMPDGTGTNVVYQALCSSPAKIDKFHGGGLLLGDYQVTLEQVASFPLAQELGLQVGQQNAAFGFWLKMDFSLQNVTELVNNTVQKKQKIAILGGGVSAVTAAFALTSQPNWQTQYDIHFYQLGWRIGGKGASGRNAKMGQRIEEHGLHIWFGFYENAFKYMQQCYQELDRPDGAALQTWQDAFKKQSFIVNTEWIKEEWLIWSLLFPEKPGDPGKGTESLSWWKLVTTLYAYLKQWLEQMHQEIDAANVQTIKQAQPQGFAEHLESLAKRLGHDIKHGINDAEHAAHGLLQFIESLPEDISQHSKDDYNWIKAILQALRKWVDEIAAQFLDNHTTIRRLFIGADLALTVLIGMIEDHVFHLGFDSINNIDFKDWLRKHHANERFTVQSAPVRALYDLIFAYEDGIIEQANLEAGTGLRGMLLIGLSYKGAVMWKMQAGMGDTVFTPYYQVLKQRGVKFNYFHEVNELKLDPNDSSIVNEIKMTRQVDLNNGPESYEPLVPVKGLSCWPSEPLYGQIVPEQAALLQDNDIDLENFWTKWPDVYQQHYNKPLPTVSLEKGKDFDSIIFGIPTASLPYTCPELLAHSASLRNSHQTVKTVVTQAYQLWTNPNLTDLGWTTYPASGEDPVLGAWTEPVDTWAAMNQLLCREDWGPLGQDPQNIAYYCGVQNVVGIPPRTDHNFPIAAKAEVKRSRIEQMNHDTYSLWPNAASPEQFKWELLTDPENRTGQARFDSQYWRSNTSPTERYTMSVVNSTATRIETKLPEFSNIYFTGDWIKTGINAGCVEAATMAGLQTSRAICGYPKIIYGEKDFV